MEDSSFQYLESQIVTATPQKLRLLLIEGAIRFARQTLECWERDQPERAVEALIRCRAIIRELLAGVQVEQSELTRRVAAIYVFLLRCLTEAHLKKDSQRVVDTIKVLEVERETWQLVCEKMPETPAPAGHIPGAAAGPMEIFAPAQGIDGPDQSQFSFNA